MRRVLIITLVVLGGCNDAEEEAPAGRRTNIGLSETALATDYEFKPHPGSRWYGPVGDRILSTGVIGAQSGPDHCGWEPAVFLHIGWPLGKQAETASEAQQYLRDPDGVLEEDWLFGRYDGEVELPKGAEYTGYRTDFMELWLDSNDDSAAYLVFFDHVEKWPRAKELLACD